MALTMTFVHASCPARFGKKVYANPYDHQLIFEEFLELVTKNYVRELDHFVLVHETFINIQKFDSQKMLNVSSRQNDMFTIACQNNIVEYHRDASRNAHIDAILEKIAPCLSKEVLAYRGNLLESFADRVLWSLSGSAYLKNRKNIEREVQFRLGGMGGVGIDVGYENSQFKIKHVAPKSPAAVAGIRMGDSIASLNGQPSTSIYPSTLFESLKGPLGSEVVLGIVSQKDNKTERSVTLKYEYVDFPDVEFEEVKGGLLISPRFLIEKSFMQIKNRIGQNEAYKFVMFDLSQCRYGNLLQMEKIANLFIEKGRLYSYVFPRTGRKHEKWASETKPRFSGKIFVLGSADMNTVAQLLLLNLRYHRQAIFIGEPMTIEAYGQQEFNSYELGHVILPVSRIYGPGGEADWGKKILPEYEIKDRSRLRTEALRLVD